MNDQTNKDLIFFAHPSPELYGSDRMVLETIRAASRTNRAILFLPSDGPLGREARSNGSVVRELRVPVLRKEYANVIGVLKTAFASIPALWRIQREVRKHRPSLIWANTITQPAWMLAAAIWRVPLVVHVREAEVNARPILRRGLMLGVSLASVVVSNSNFTEDFVRSNLPRAGTTKRKLVVVYNGKDWTPFHTEQSGPVSEPARLLVVGRLSPRKGQDLVLRSMSLLAERGVETTVTFAGDVYPGYEWYRDELEQTARDLRLHERCDFVGFVDDPAKLYGEADIVLVPSRAEPFGTVAAEALAASRPTIVSAVEGLREIITDGVNGLLFAPNDPVALSEQISRLLTNPAFARELGDRGRADVESRFSLESYRSAISGIIELARKSA